MNTKTLYHLSPSRYRRSIEREGIRRSSMLAGRLVTYVYSSWPLNGHAVNIADLHDTMAEYIDIWKITCECDYVDYLVPGERTVRVDIPPDCVEIARYGKLER